MATSILKDNTEGTQNPVLTLDFLLWHHPPGVFKGFWAFHEGLGGVESDIRKYLLVENLVRGWEVMESPSLELLKSRVGCGTWGHGLEVALAVLGSRAFPS